MSRKSMIPSLSSPSSLMYPSISLVSIVASAMKESGTNPFWHSATNSCTTLAILRARTFVKIL
eukprot:5621822-Prymnesium_polylepis.1